MRLCIWCLLVSSGRLRADRAHAAAATAVKRAGGDTRSTHAPVLLKDGHLNMTGSPRAAVPDLAVFPRQAEPRPVLDQPDQPEKTQKYTRQVENSKKLTFVMSLSHTLMLVR